MKNEFISAFKSYKENEDKKRTFVVCCLFSCRFCFRFREANEFRNVVWLLLKYIYILLKL